MLQILEDFSGPTTPFSVMFANIFEMKICGVRVFMSSQFASFSKSVITVYAPWGESFFHGILTLGMVGRNEEKRKFQGSKSE